MSSPSSLSLPGPSSSWQMGHFSASMRYLSMKHKSYLALLNPTAGSDLIHLSRACLAFFSLKDIPSPGFEVMVSKTPTIISLYRPYAALEMSFGYLSIRVTRSWGEPDDVRHTGPSCPRKLLAMLQLMGICSATNPEGLQTSSETFSYVLHNQMWPWIGGTVNSRVHECPHCPSPQTQHCS